MIETLIRDIQPFDKPGLVRFHSRLSPETRYRRYHAVKGDLTRGDLRYLTEVDGHRHIALVAQDEAGELLGVARVVAYADDPGRSELAVVVRDDIQHAGVGAELVEAVLERAGEEGHEEVVLEVQADNHRALRFFQGLGARQRQGGGVGTGAVRQLVIEPGKLGESPAA